MTMRIENRLGINGDSINGDSNHLFTSQPEEVTAQVRINGYSPHLCQAGFTLLELVAAFFILSVGVFGAMTMYHFGIAKTKAVSENRAVLNAIQNEVECLRALPFGELENRQAGPFLATSPTFKRLVNVTPALTIRDYPGVEGRLKEVTAQIRWTGEHGRTIAKSVTTLIADTGPGGAS
jgi:Tfp pilus assembly protein PilE